MATRTTTPRPAIPGLLATALAVVGMFTVGGGDAAAQGRERPNVVVVMTDDQDLATMRAMRAVERHLGRGGVTFENAFATFPLCCPSRASFLTGQYAHNNGVMSNKPPDGGFAAFDDRGTLPVSLRRAGYRTGFVGKYLNQYGSKGTGSRRYVPPGWNEWHAPVGETQDVHQMYGYTLNENGRLRHYGNTADDYQTDVFAKKAARFVQQSDGRGKPFFLTLWSLAPHAEHGRPKRAGRDPRPAPRHRDRYLDAQLPKSPNFNEADVSDKPSFVRSKPRLRRSAVSWLEERHQDRLASLLAVDDAVGRLVSTLRRTGELRNTVIIFTSDNGYLSGAHRLRAKEFLYEESVRVPLLMSGPGIPAGQSREQIVGNTDLAPTILDLANAQPSRELDGRSLLRFARKPTFGAGRDILLENQASEAVRTPEYMYAEHPDGETELYDMEADPFQLRSRHDAQAYAGVRATLAHRLAQLRDCFGKGCR